MTSLNNVEYNSTTWFCLGKLGTIIHWSAFGASGTLHGQEKTTLGFKQVIDQ